MNVPEEISQILADTAIGLLNGTIVSDTPERQAYVTELTNRIAAVWEGGQPEQLPVGISTTKPFLKVQDIMHEETPWAIGQNAENEDHIFGKFSFVVMAVGTVSYKALSPIINLARLILRETQGPQMNGGKVSTMLEAPRSKMPKYYADEKNKRYYFSGYQFIALVKRTEA